MIKTAHWIGGSEEEYETQHFGFGSQRLKISIRQMTEQKIVNGLKDMDLYLQESLNLNETDKATLTKSCNKLFRLYCERLQPHMENIDKEIEKILTVPSNVLLPCDECQVEQKTNSELEKIREEVADLRKRVIRGALMETLLTAEVEEISALYNIGETAKNHMEAVDRISKYSEMSLNVKSLLNETMFLCSNINMAKIKDCDLFDD